ncbi:MAG: DUF4173 domain-containing protein [Anaerolineales bacterium]|jgi:hypothetical protein|nr:DUF4173 domain-containing protein [Anaerolineales bacterium]
MQKYSKLLWLLAFGLGWLFDLLFWNLNSPGISFPLFSALTLALGILLLWRAGIRPARNTWLLLAPIAFFVAFTFIRLEPLTTFLGYSLTLLLMGVLVLTYQSGLWPLYSLADYFVGFLRMLLSLAAAPLLFQNQVSTQKAESDDSKKRASAFWPILRGLLFAIPVLAFFTTLLISADMVFAQRVEGLVDLFRLERLPEYIFRLIYISILAYALAGIFLHAAKNHPAEKLIGQEKPVVPAFLGFTESSIVLVSVNLLFASFVFIQFQYFFGGLKNITLDGYTYADYARNGFGELVTVAFFSLLLFLSLSSITRRAAGRQRQFFSGLGIFLVAMVGVMLASAFQRLVLYEIAYGFTRLRTYTHVFILWLGLLLLATIIFELRNRQRVFALAAIVASLGFAASLSLMNVDAFIVRQNISRQLQGDKLDVGYLASLSSDAIPVLAGFYKSETLDASTRDQVGAALACFNALAVSRPESESKDWRSFHLSRFLAERQFESLNLRDYKLQTENYNDSVLTPLGKTYDCYSPWMD